MNNISDYEAHKRDEEYDNSAEAQRHWRAMPKCPIHGIPLIAGQGYVENGKTFTEVFATPQCPECLRKP